VLLKPRATIAIAIARTIQPHTGGTGFPTPEVLGTHPILIFSKLFKPRRGDTALPRLIPLAANPRSILKSTPAELGERPTGDPVFPTL